MAFRSFPKHILATGKSEITALDVVMLRDGLLHDGPVTYAEVLALTALEASAAPKHPTWNSLYIDALVAFTITDTAPEGYLDTGKAECLLALAAPAGRAVTPTVFEMLTAVLAAARWVPERLTVALLDEVLCAVACGTGVLRVNGTIAPATLTTTDVERVRRILYGAIAPGQPAAISRREAMSLLAIDAAAADWQDRSWTRLFTAAMLDAALTASSMAGPPREVLLGPSRADPLAGYRALAIEERTLATLERQRVAIIAGDDPAPFEAEALVAALDRQPDTPAMSALTALLADAGPLLHPRLKGWLDSRLTPSTVARTVFAAA